MAEQEINKKIEDDFDDENRKPSPVRIIVTVVVVLAILAGTFFAVTAILKTKKAGPGGFGGPGKGFGGPGGFGQGGGTVTSVVTMVAEPETMHDYVNANGDIETQRSIDVYPSISGKVVQVNVSLGSTVKSGAIIAYVDPSAAGVNYKWSPITAPMSGSVLQAPVKLGQQISTNTVVTKIGDIDNLQISVSIPERYVGDLKIGLKAEVTLEAYPDVVFDASVVKISPVLDAVSRTKTVILNFDKKDSRLNAGMFAKVKLYTVDYPDSIVMPQDAIVAVNEDNFLYVVKEDNTVEKRLVTLGKNVNGNYQITSGINPGDKVVVAGMLTLSDGSQVRDITNGVPEEEKTEGFKPEGAKPEDGQGKGRS